jgi:hypothetical protein
MADKPLKAQIFGRKAGPLIERGPDNAFHRGYFAR